MTDHVKIRGLFETHPTVSNLQRSIDFYRDVVGLELALEVSERNSAFFWIGDSRRSMLGLWSVGTVPLGLTLHVAFEVTMNDLLDAPTWLKAQGITPISIFGVETMEPSVIGWMPAAALYFRYPDGHLIEYLTMLERAKTRARNHSLVRVDCPQQLKDLLDRQVEQSGYRMYLRLLHSIACLFLKK